VSKQCAGFVALARRQHEHERKCLGESVEIVRQDAQLQTPESCGVGCERLMAKEAGPRACLQWGAGTCAQKERAALGPREMAFDERQEESFERPIFAAVSAHRTLRRAVASP
jgi:hypothetical protein